MIMKLITAMLSFIVTIAFAAAISAGVSAMMNWFKMPSHKPEKKHESIEIR